VSEPDLRAVAVAGHTGDATIARAGLTSADPAVRAAALGALQRLRALDVATLTASLSDTDATVRRRAAEISAAYPAVDLLTSLDDPDDRVVEVAAWACGEHESYRDDIIERLVDLAGTADDPLVRESAVAALGAIGDERGLDAIIAACGDKPAVRRRAVLALAPFEGPEVDATIERALTDRDWQVRQAAEDLRRAQS
jgi:HEAT repeat protein